MCCDLLKIHYLCGRNDNLRAHTTTQIYSCDLLKIHYLCGRNDNLLRVDICIEAVVICSKFITFVVEMTTKGETLNFFREL